MATGAALTPEELTASRLAKAPAPGISTAQAPVSGGFCALMTPEEDVAKSSVTLKKPVGELTNVPFRISAGTRPPRWLR
jgi:hypothetical protein